MDSRGALACWAVKSEAGWRKHLQPVQAEGRWVAVLRDVAGADKSFEVPNFCCCRMYKRHNQGEQLAVVESVINDLRREMAVDSIP